MKFFEHFYVWIELKKNMGKLRIPGDVQKSSRKSNNQGRVEYWKSRVHSRVESCWLLKKIESRVE